MKKTIALALAFTLVVASSGGAFAAGNKSGFGSNSGQGNLSNENVQEPANPGTTSETGPKGQLKRTGSPCNNCVTDLPGNR